MPRKFERFGYIGDNPLCHVRELGGKNRAGHEMYTNVCTCTCSKYASEVVEALNYFHNKSKDSKNATQKETKNQ
jgi:hypothetical protein